MLLHFFGSRCYYTNPLIIKGVSKKELPESTEAYRKLIKKHLAVHNGKLMKEFEDLYDELHIAGYYRGMLHSVGAVKEIFKTAKAFINKINH